MDNAAPAPPPAARPRILVVEDDFLIRLMLAEMLSDEGYDVVEAGSGDAALPLLDASIALLMTDLHLPGTLDGLGLAEQGRRMRPELPVIYMSGRLLGGERLGPRDLAIGKPYQHTDVAAGVAKMLAG